MKLSEIAASVRVDLEKVAGYVLNPTHTRGRHKARTFAWLGYTPEHAEHLRAQLLASAPDQKAIFHYRNEYGARYRVFLTLTGPNGKAGRIRTVWIIKPGTDSARLVTAWVEEVVDA